MVVIMSDCHDTVVMVRPSENWCLMSIGAPGRNRKKNVCRWIKENNFPLEREYSCSIIHKTHFCLKKKYFPWNRIFLTEHTLAPLWAPGKCPVCQCHQNIPTSTNVSNSHQHHHHKRQESCEI